MRLLLLPLLASVLSGVSAIFEKVSVVSLSGLTVLTLRYVLMAPVLIAALYATGAHRELRTIDARTFGAIALPAAMALGSLLLYFTALTNDLVWHGACVAFRCGRRARPQLRRNTECRRPT